MQSDLRARDRRGVVVCKRKQMFPSRLGESERKIFVTEEIEICGGDKRSAAMSGEKMSELRPLVCR